MRGNLIMLRIIDRLIPTLRVILLWVALATRLVVVAELLLIWLADRVLSISLSGIGIIWLPIDCWHMGWDILRLLLGIGSFDIVLSRLSDVLSDYWGDDVLNWDLLIGGWVLAAVLSCVGL
jgi:hypothetical protein